MWKPGESARFDALVAGAILAVFLGLSYSESAVKSAAFDEPAHIAAGLSYLETGVFRANLQHPPLLKEISGLSMLLGGIRWPRIAATAAYLRGDPGTERWEWPIGEAILTRNGPDRVLRWARFPFPLLASLLGALIYLWGRQVVGPLAALGAVFLYALDPTILAHSFLVTMDVGLAAFTVLFFFALWNYLRDGSVKRLVLCGLALGALLGAKFSGVFLLPVAAVLLLAALRWPADPDAERKAGRFDPYVARLVGPNDACPCGSGKRFKKCHGAKGLAIPVAKPDPLRGARLCLAAFAAMCLLAYIVIQALYLFPGDPLQYVDGIRLVNADHNNGWRFFMAGSLAPRFTSYFLVAYLLKEPLPAIILAAIGLAALLRGRQIPVIGKLFLILPPAAIFVGHTIWADDLGIRYIMAALPFAYLLGGLGLATLLGSAARWARWAAIPLCAWSVLAAAGVYPDHLSYFNESACLLTNPGQTGIDGGTRCGPLWLDDSNVDWGQGLKQLKTWLDRNAPGRTVQLAYFGSVDPADYGIRGASISSAALEQGSAAPGLYAVSANFIARASESAWVRKVVPRAIVGHAMYVFDIARR
jgi:hypothetical protein